MKQLVVFIGVAFCICFQTKAQDDILESAIYSCLDSTFISFDLFQELEAFELLLVKNEQLQGLPVDYQALFRKLKNDKSYVFYRDYQQKTPLDSLFNPEFRYCFNKFRHTDLFDASDSFYKRLSLALEQGKLRGHNSSYEFFIDNLWDTIRTQDFKNRLFRYYAIYTIYVGALNSQKSHK